MSCSWIETTIIVQFPVKFGSRAGRAVEELFSPCGTVPSPVPLGTVEPCKMYSFLCMYFIGALRWAKLGHSSLQQQKT